MFVPTGLNAWARFRRRVAVRLRAERHDVRVRGGLEDRAARRHREQGDEERLVGHDLARRVEQERAERRKREAGEDARLVAEALVDEGRRQREQEVGAEVRELHERRLERAHVEDALEARDHRRGQVLRDPPRGEARDQRDEQHQHALAEQRLDSVLAPSPQRRIRGRWCSTPRLLSWQMLHACPTAVAPRCGRPIESRVVLVERRPVAAPRVTLLIEPVNNVLTA